MKREQREPYRYLGDISNLGLCNFCKFAEFNGSWCCADLECHHPLPVLNEDEDIYDNVWAGGGDCWGFRPRCTLQECGAIASISMQGATPHWTKRGELVAIVPKELVSLATSSKERKEQDGN